MKTERKQRSHVHYVREHYSKQVRKTFLEKFQQSLNTLDKKKRVSRKSTKDDFGHDLMLSDLSHEEKLRKDELYQSGWTWTLVRKKRRIWTLNRSPHGNKTAREQFGRDRWQRRILGFDEKEKENRLEKRRGIDQTDQRNRKLRRKEIRRKQRIS